jgi:hypothetical protein
MKPNAARMPSKRTQIVWLSFFLVIPCALLILRVGTSNIQSGLLLTTLAPFEERPEVDPVFATLDDDSDWTSVVIHHLEQPAGNLESVDRDHRNAGLRGLGFHFLIGNGNGLGDGDIQIGYRWLNQTPAAKPASISSGNWNSGVVSICLIGNGNRRPFTEQQMQQLSHLVQRLQQELSISANHVFLGRELGTKNNSPGEFFAEAQFQSQLLDIPNG